MTATIQADKWEIRFGDRVFKSSDLKVTASSNESDRIKVPDIKFSATLDIDDYTSWRALHKKVFDDFHRDANNKRNEFIESYVRKYMSINEISIDDLQENAVRYTGPNWDQYNYKDDMIVRVDTELNWDEGSVGYRYSVNEVLK